MIADTLTKRLPREPLERYAKSMGLQLNAPQYHQLWAIVWRISVTQPTLHTYQ